MVRAGTRRMPAAAPEDEVNTYVAELAAECDEGVRRPEVRKRLPPAAEGHHRPGTIEVEAPRVNDKRVDEATGERKRFSSAILPPWCRKSPKISEVLPLLHLYGLSSGYFVPALVMGGAQA